jgi:hypothetical protein
MGKNGISKQSRHKLPITPGLASLQGLRPKTHITKLADFDWTRFMLRRKER